MPLPSLLAPHQANLSFCSPVPDGYGVLPNYDHPGDFLPLPTQSYLSRSSTLLAAACDADPMCGGFTSMGMLKALVPVTADYFELASIENFCIYLKDGTFPGESEVEERNLPSWYWHQVAYS